MAEIGRRLRAPIGIALIVILVGWRFMFIEENDDVALQRAVTIQLMHHLGDAVSERIKQTDLYSPRAVDELLATSSADDVVIHSIKVSKPAFTSHESFAAVVRVEYTLSSAEREVGYFEYTHSSTSGWAYFKAVGAVNYYLPFL